MGGNRALAATQISRRWRASCVYFAGEPHLEPRMSRPVLISYSSEVKKTALTIRELHPAPTPETLNEEWILLENTGPNSINVRACSLTVAENVHRRPHSLGTLDPGFILASGAKIRIVTGSPAKKAQGTPPAESDELKNYHLFLKEQVLSQAGVVVRLTLKQLDLARAVFAPEAAGGLEPV
jgi:hypothetical protein